MIAVEEYLERPIIGAYFYLLGRLKTKKDIDRYLEVMRNASINSVWLFVGGVEKWKIKYFLDKAEELGLKVVPVFQPHISINEHPEVKVVCADGTTADDPRYANIGCFNNPLLFNVAKEMVEDFIKEGIDFVSFGTNDLTQYTLALDRNNERVAKLYTEKHKAVQKLIKEVILTCRKYGVETSICGQAGSDPEIAEKLVEYGITSISANPDAVEVVREMVARTELRLLLDRARE